MVCNRNDKNNTLQLQKNNANAFNKTKNEKKKKPISVQQLGEIFFSFGCKEKQFFLYLLFFISLLNLFSNMNVYSINNGTRK
jgi:hypothetical protein